MGDRHLEAIYSALMATPPMVQCVGCGGVTESENDCTKISYLRSRSWRCPDCYRLWRRNAKEQQGVRHVCAVARCRSGELPPDAVREVLDPLTEAIYIVCPKCEANIASLKERQSAHVALIKDSAYKEGFSNGAVAGSPVTKNFTIPGDPNAVRNIAATLEVIAPDLSQDECGSLAQSFFDMAVPMMTIPGYANKDPDADPKVLNVVDYLKLLGDAGRIGPKAGIKTGDIALFDFSKVELVQGQRPHVGALDEISDW